MITQVTSYIVGHRAVSYTFNTACMYNTCEYIINKLLNLQLS